MKRPCGCDSCVIGEPWIRRRDCRFCWLYWNDPRYRQLWNEPAAPLVAPPPSPKPPADGPGAELAEILKELGISNPPGCDCSQKMAIMNAWGPAGCRQNVAVIKRWLDEAQAAVSWLDKIAAAARSVGKFKINPLDVAGSLIGHAIRRAEEKAKSAGMSSA